MVLNGWYKLLDRQQKLFKDIFFYVKEQEVDEILNVENEMFKWSLYNVILFPSKKHVTLFVEHAEILDYKEIQPDELEELKSECL